MVAGTHILVIETKGDTDRQLGRASLVNHGTVAVNVMRWIPIDFK